LALSVIFLDERSKIPITLIKFKEVGQSLSLHTIIAVSDQQLSEQARTALNALSVLPHKPNVFSEDAALAISDAPVTALDELLDTGLLESSGDERYSLHQTIADYAHLHLQEIAPYERLIQYAHDVVEAHKANYELLDLESGTILAALESVYRCGKKQELVQVACKLTPFLCIRGNYSLAERHIQRVHDAAVTLKDE
jgi:hypothetical protein